MVSNKSVDFRLNVLIPASQHVSCRCDWVEWVLLTFQEVLKGNVVLGKIVSNGKYRFMTLPEQ